MVIAGGSTHRCHHPRVEESFNGAGDGDRRRAIASAFELIGALALQRSRRW